MRIPHPLLGLRDASEFVYKGDASLIDRPDGMDESAEQLIHDYLYVRKNPRGTHRELWFHEQGDRSWLIVTRNTLTHAIESAELVRTDADQEGAK